MKYIYVGFKGKHNPSSYIVSKFQESFFLTNSYLGIDRDIEKIKEDKDGILLFGLKPGLTNKIQIELLSRRNHKDLKTTWDLSKLNSIFKGLDIVYNDIPTNYLCNYAYYSLLEKFDGNVLLIHVPFSKEYADQIIMCIKENIG